MKVKDQQQELIFKLKKKFNFMKYPMTQNGFKFLIEELKQLKTKTRPRVIQEVAEARSHGDLSENAEYDAAREKQSMIEGRIRELEAKLANAQVIDKNQLKTSRVVFGTTVTIMDIDSAEKTIWTIVGEDEANLKERKISVLSPFAQSIIGKSVGDQVEIITPKRRREFEILSIEIY